MKLHLGTRSFGRSSGIARVVSILCACAVLFPLACFADTDERKNYAFDAIDRNAEQIALTGDSLYYFAELGMQEFESTRFLKETLEGIGFKVELGGAGMPTNLWAQWGAGKPKIVILTEIDALPEGSQTPGSIVRKPLVEGAPGHMEGHNTHGAVAVGAAYAVKRAMERYNIPGSVAISFGPAEEQLISRPFLLRAGYFKDTDAAIFIHIKDVLSTGYGLQTYAAISAKFTFHGKTAHAALNPWDGKDAVDAVELMDIGFDKLREHLRPSYRAHRAITLGGLQPNIIPDVGQIWWWVRDATGPAASETYDKLVNIAKGAALMTGTTFEVELNAAAWPALGNRVIGEAIQKNIEAVGIPQWSNEEMQFAKEFQASVGKPQVGLSTTPVAFGANGQVFASDDKGDVTWNVPTGMLFYPAIVPGVSVHHWTAGVTPISSIAHKGSLVGAKVLAASILDLLTSAELLQKSKQQFLEDTKDTRYVSQVPPDAKPPIDLNRDIMEKYRSEMRKFYLNKTPRFN